MGSHAGLLEGFRQSRVGVAGTRQVFGTRSVLDADHCLRDHLARSWTDDVRSQQAVSLLVGQDFDHAVGVGNGFGAGVGEEGEDSLVELDVCVKERLLLALSSSSV